MLDWTLFRKRCNEPSVLRAAEALGGLSRWWLSPTALKVLAKVWGCESVPLPSLARDAGCCGVIFVNKDPETLTLLRQALVLPLRWQSGIGHDPRLREWKSLLSVADDVVQRMVAAGDAATTQQWGLQLINDGETTIPELTTLGEADLFPAESGWAALAGGLWTAVSGHSSQGGVWATGRWNQGLDIDKVVGIDEVEGLHDKLTVASELGANEVFVPDSQAIRLGGKFIGCDGREVLLGSLKMNVRNPYRALGPYFASLKAPPHEDADPEDQARHYCDLQELSPYVARADAFYHERLLSPIAARCREKLDRQPGRPDRLPTVLITVVSGNYGLVRLGIEMLRATHCLAFYTRDNGDMTRNAQTVEAEIKRLNCCRLIDCEFKLQDFDAEPVSMLKTFHEHVAQFVHNTVGENDPGAVAFDVTPGTGLMTLAWPLVARTGNWLIYLQHEMIGKIKRFNPFSESYLMWRAGESWEHHVGRPRAHGDSA